MIHSVCPRVSFMNAALHWAETVLCNVEVHVDCVFLNSIDEIMVSGRNKTKESRNGSRHS
jgi:hypothetical protein